MKFSLKVFLHFRVEVFLWLIMMAITLRSVTFTQLIQDKICKFNQNMNDTFCRHLSDLADDDIGSDIKSSVLVESSQFNMYYQALSFVPSIIASLFLGSWCDNYKPGRKILLYISALGITMETAIMAYIAYDFKLDYWYLMTGAVPAALGGGLATALIAVYSYIPATTPPDLTTTRFMVAEVVIWLSTPVGTLLGGYLLNYNVEHPLGGRGQLLNYQMVFITSAVCTILAMFWAIFFVNEKRDKLSLDKFSNDPAFIYKQIQRAQHRKSQIRPLDSIVEEGSTKNPFKLLFNWGNVRDVVKTATKRRPNRGRLQIWLIVSSFVFLMLAFMAPLYVMYPFAQKVYLWDSQKFSIYNSVAMFLNSFGILFGTMILIKLFKLNDIPLAICGISTFMVSSIIRATFPNLWGFWGSTIAGSLGGMGSIGIRSYVSKIVNEDEVGKIFSLISSIDGSIPFVGNFFFTMIFTQTLDTFPGAVFDASGSLLLIPLFALIFIDLYCKKSADRLDLNSNKRSKDYGIKDKDSNRFGDQLTYRTKKGRALRQRSTEL